MEESLQDFKSPNERAAEEYVTLAGFLNGVTEIGDLVPVSALCNQFCKQAFKVYQDSFAKGTPADLAKLGQAMGDNGMVAELLSVAKEYRTEPEHALSIVRQIRRRHEGAILATELGENLVYLQQGFEAEEAAERCRIALDRFHEAMGGNAEATSVSAILRECGDRIMVDRKAGGASFGIPTLDDRIGGLHPGELLIVAARPKKGKSSLMLSIVEAANLPSCVFSLEMTRRECLKSLICIHAHVPSDALMDHLEQIDLAKNALRKRQIDIFDRPAMTGGEVAAACYARRNTRLVAVDYAQIMGRVRSAESARESLVENVKSLKNLAKRLNVTVILGSQIGRGGDEKPSVKELAESDELLRSADHVLVFNWDEDEPPHETKWNRPPVSVTVKLTSRHMPNSSFPLDFHRSQRRFAECGAGDF